jgi:hypothetical protein
MDSDQKNEIFQFILSVIIDILFQSTPLSLLFSIYCMVSNWLFKSHQERTILSYQLQYLLPLFCVLNLFYVGYIVPTFPMPEPSTIQITHRID